MFTAHQPHRPTGVTKKTSPPPHVSVPHTQVRYDSSVRHPVFFTSRLGKPGFAPSPNAQESGVWNPVAQGYMLRKEDGGVKL
ncbi:hypothetical protein EX30DRAFT_371891 [Ascodesmis nigricans]|uniref:Uncharacterized protein n=1 Tax=Ascodesmis nigricans TaxID=341454 RepID=A0A4S2MW66_9PEZI|nr:hypothetical protein EX30DRAFT_371891 [Ascodesmis nigricans]